MVFVFFLFGIMSLAENGATMEKVRLSCLARYFARFLLMERPDASFLIRIGTTGRRTSSSASTVLVDVAASHNVGLTMAPFAEELAVAFAAA